MNIIHWGMTWHNALRNAGTTEQATIDHIGGTLTVPATKINPRAIVNTEGVRQNAQHVLFMFNKRDVERVRFVRGTKITYKNEAFEVVIDRTTREEDDDPSGLTLNVTAKRIS